MHVRVVNASGGVPVASASVQLIGITDTTTIARAAVRPDGNFAMSGIAMGNYRLIARALGFAPRILPITLTVARTRVDAGTIVLNVAATELQRLTITEQAQRQVELAPDRNTYTVKDMPTTRGGSLVDVLRTIPSVDVDIDNLVSLRGDGGVSVQINGRPSPMKPAQLGNFLAQLSAALVEKVEVISNPSARDNPEGSSGIINIVLNEESRCRLERRTDVGAGHHRSHRRREQRGLSTWRPHHVRQLRPAE